MAPVVLRLVVAVMVRPIGVRPQSVLTELPTPEPVAVAVEAHVRLDIARLAMVAAV
jgi:hypothetical protein